jgi:pimeloyl-ACP methyl ester carboxylesterase
MTTSGARSLPQAQPHVRRALLDRPKGRDADAAVSYLEHLLHLIGSPAYRPDPQRQRERITAMVRRSWRPQGTMRQLLAVVADGDRSALLRHIVAPTRIVHGEDDPLIPVVAAHDLARKIHGAVLDVIPGMGHDLPLPLLPRLADAMAENAARAVGTG